MRGEEPITQFGGMGAKLGIRIIAAHSPQAKGRVERIHGTHQDRLVKKLRRKKISTLAEANGYLEASYLAEHNRRFGRPPGKPEDYHRRAPSASELDRIFRLESERTVSQDWVVGYGNRFLQLERQSRQGAPAKSKVLVCEARDGSLAIRYRGQSLAWREIPGPVKPRPEETRTAAAPALSRRKWVPPADHPWRNHPRQRKEPLKREAPATAARTSSNALFIWATM